MPRYSGPGLIPEIDKCLVIYPGIIPLFLVTGVPSGNLTVAYSRVTANARGARAVIKLEIRRDRVFGEPGDAIPVAPSMAMAAISSWQADAGRAVTPRRPRPRRGVTEFWEEDFPGLKTGSHDKSD